MRLTMGEERVIVRGIRPEEGLWGERGGFRGGAHFLKKKK